MYWHSGESQKEIDILLLPGDASIQRVTVFNGCAVTKARIYSLAYENGDAYYFWMQVEHRF